MLPFYVELYQKRSWQPYVDVLQSLAGNRIFRPRSVERPRRGKPQRTMSADQPRHIREQHHMMSSKQKEVTLATDHWAATGIQQLLKHSALNSRVIESTLDVTFENGSKSMLRTGKLSENPYALTAADSHQVACADSATFGHILTELESSFVGEMQGAEHRDDDHHYGESNEYPNISKITATSPINAAGEPEQRLLCTPPRSRSAPSSAPSSPDKLQHLSSNDTNVDLNQVSSTYDAQNWRRVLLPDGRVYYFDRVTRQSQWQLPDQVPPHLVRTVNQPTAITSVSNVLHDVIVEPASYFPVTTTDVHATSSTPPSEHTNAAENCDADHHQEDAAVHCQPILTGEESMLEPALISSPMFQHSVPNQNTSNTTASALSPSTEVADVHLEMCPHCHRRFAASRLDAHAPICQRFMTTQSRKPFDAHAYRIKNTPASSISYISKQVPPCTHCGKKFPLPEDLRLHLLLCKKDGTPERVSATPSKTHNRSALSQTMRMDSSRTYATPQRPATTAAAPISLAATTPLAVIPQNTPTPSKEWKSKLSLLRSKAKAAPSVPSPTSIATRAPVSCGSCGSVFRGAAALCEHLVTCNSWLTEGQEKTTPQRRLSFEETTVAETSFLGNTTLLPLDAKLPFPSRIPLPRRAVLPPPAPTATPLRQIQSTTDERNVTPSVPRVSARDFTLQPYDVLSPPPSAVIPLDKQPIAVKDMTCPFCSDKFPSQVFWTHMSACNAGNDTTVDLSADGQKTSEQHHQTVHSDVSTASVAAVEEVPRQGEVLQAAKDQVVAENFPLLAKLKAALSVAKHNTTSPTPMPTSSLVDRQRAEALRVLTRQTA